MSKAVMSQELILGTDDHALALSNSKFLELPKADLCVHFNEVNPDIRKDLGYSNPFPATRGKKWQGCYLFWSEVAKWDLTKNVFDPDALIWNDRILPLYAGRSSALPTRLWQHCTWRTRWIEQYFNDDWTINKGGELYQLDFPYAFIWLIQDEKERQALEHLIIGTVRPIYNKQ